MRTRSTMVTMLLAGAVALSLAGCGDGNDNEIFIGDEPTATPGTGRTATPLPNATPTVTNLAATATATPGSVATATATQGVPTATATPVAGGCQTGDQIVVTESLDHAYGGAILELAYPASLNLPGTGTAQSVSDRVEFTVAGLTTANDTDDDADGTDDKLTTSLVTFADHDAGTFATITFDCVAGQAPPAVSDLTCTVVSAATGGGVAIPGVNCSLTLTGP